MDGGAKRPRGWAEMRRARRREAIEAIALLAVVVALVLFVR